MATSRTRKRRTRADGERSYQLIVDAAARLATIEGLEGLSIGRLADEIGMSKSGLYAHFDSKQDLQLAAVDAAEAIFTSEVVAPAMRAPEGVQRLELLCERLPVLRRARRVPRRLLLRSPPPPNGTPVAARSESAYARSSTAGPSCSKPTCARPSSKATCSETPTPTRSASNSTPYCTKRTATTCSSGTPPRSIEPAPRSATDSPIHTPTAPTDPGRPASIRTGLRRLTRANRRHPRTQAIPAITAQASVLRLEGAELLVVRARRDVDPAEPDGRRA